MGPVGSGRICLTGSLGPHTPSTTSERSLPDLPGVAKTLREQPPVFSPQLPITYQHPFGTFSDHGGSEMGSGVWEHSHSLGFWHLLDHRLQGLRREQSDEVSPWKWDMWEHAFPQAVQSGGGLQALSCPFPLLLSPFPILPLSE